MFYSMLFVIIFEFILNIIAGICSLVFGGDPGGWFLAVNIMLFLVVFPVFVACLGHNNKHAHM